MGEHYALDSRTVQIYNSREAGTQIYNRYAPITPLILGQLAYAVSSNI